MSATAQSGRQQGCHTAAAAAAVCDAFHHAPVNTPILIELLASLF